MFLGSRSCDWREVRLEDVGEFVAGFGRRRAGTAGWWCCRPGRGHCGDATVNRKLPAVNAFYQHQARNGVDLGDLLTTWQPVGGRGTAWRPFLYRISNGQTQAWQTLRMKVAGKHPRVLTVDEVQRILDACDRLRDRPENRRRSVTCLQDSTLAAGISLIDASRGRLRA